ncbi:MAG: hypothetical protein L0216_03705 [Planctomycetales bacterium]|nr:hypothetical protein [Planctomycetales bacterium]
MPRWVWLLVLVAAASVGAVVAWRGALTEEGPLQVPPRTLGPEDLALFDRLCGELAADRESLRAEVPRGQGILEFVTLAARNPRIVRPACDRLGTVPARALAVAAELGLARRLDRELTRWDAEAEGRAQARTRAGETLAAHGRPDLAPEPETEPELPPGRPDLSPRERGNLEAYRAARAEISRAWGDLMGEAAAER